MMKLKCCRVLVKSTEPATAARLLNQLALHSPPSLRHSGGTAFHTSKPTIGAFEERCVSMPGAAKVRLAKACFAGRIAFASTDGSLGLQPQALEPVANGRVPGAEVIGHRSDRGAFLDHPAQAISIDPSADRTLRCSSPSHPLGVGYAFDQGGALAAERCAVLGVVGFARFGDLGLEAALLEQQEVKLHRVG